MRRRLLTSFVAVAGAIAFLLLLTMFGTSLRPSQRAAALGIVEIDVADLAPGNMQAFPTHVGPIFAYRPTASTFQDLTIANDNVRDPQVTSFNRDLGVFLVVGVSTLQGCVLNHIAPDDPQFRLNYNFWHGGYFDPCHGAIYDYAGRAYDIGLKTRNLETVKVRTTSGTTAWLQLVGS
jgi:ubiquinol-cytochrome c reductase iron-sulfur subunit